MLFDEGSRLMTEGKLVEACDAFEASQRIEQRAGTLIRLGDCRERNHQLASAWSAYKDALTVVKDPRKREIATARIADLEPKLSYLAVMVADESRVDGLTLTRNGQVLDPALWNRAVPVDGGEYVIGGSAPGHDEWKSVVIVPIENGKINVEVPKFKDLAKLLSGGTPAPKVDDPERANELAPSRFTTRRKLAIGVAGVGAAAVVSGIVARTVGQGRQRDALSLCPEPSACPSADRANELSGSGHRLVVGGHVAIGVGAAAVVVAGVLWLSGAPEGPARRLPVVPLVSAEASGLLVSGWF